MPKSPQFRPASFHTDTIKRCRAYGSPHQICLLALDLLDALAYRDPFKDTDQIITDLDPRTRVALEFFRRPARERAVREGKR